MILSSIQLPKYPTPPLIAISAPRADGKVVMRKRSHAPAVHVPPPHEWPQAPQLFGSLARVVSQPFAGSPSQSPVPDAQHWPSAHPFAHAWPQPPQFAASFAVSTSQPFAGSPSQSAKPAAHAPTAHAPPAHAAVAFGTTHGAHAAGPQPNAGSASSTHCPPHTFRPGPQPAPPVPPALLEVHQSSFRLPIKRLGSECQGTPGGVAR
jgi:hypothetical protein